MTRLAVIDLQHVFADRDSAWFVPRIQAILDPVARLVAAYGDDVIFTRFVAPSSPVGAWRDYYAQFPFAAQPPDAASWRLIEPFADRPTLDATTFGKFGPALDVADLVVTGVATDCCVLSTVLAAADAGVRVSVVADACAGSSDDAHQAALDLMALYAPLVRITSSATVLAG